MNICYKITQYNPRSYDRVGFNGYTGGYSGGYGGGGGYKGGYNGGPPPSAFGQGQGTAEEKRRR